MLDLSNVDISANGPSSNRGLEYSVPESELSAALSSVFALETGRVLVLYNTDHWALVDAGLRHSTMWEYKIVAAKTFNAVMKCMASHGVGKKLDTFKADTVVYIDSKVPHYSVLDTARSHMKHTRKLGAFIFLKLELSK